MSKPDTSRVDVASWHNTDDADWQTVLAEVQRCAAHWEPEARLIGNVRAGDIVRAIDALTPPERAASPSGESGWRWVPKMPTPDMARAAQDAIAVAQKDGWAGLHPYDVYHAMLAAAPPAPDVPAQAESEAAQWKRNHDDIVANNRPLIASLRARIRQLEAEAAASRAEVNETFIDERGNSWIRPTAEAYYRICMLAERRVGTVVTLENALAASRAQADALAGALEQIRRELPKDDPGPAFDEASGMWRSFGNYDDVAKDAAAEAEWALAQKIDAALAAHRPGSATTQTGTDKTGGAE